MKSATPKVLHEICGRSLVGHVLAAAGELEPENLVVVVGHAREKVTAHLAETDPDVRTAVQARAERHRARRTDRAWRSWAAVSTGPSSSSAATPRC